VAISKETTKNLLDVMQKLSLAIAAVCLALVSNLAISGGDLERKAGQELTHLLKIRDQPQITNLSAIEIIDHELDKTGRRFNETREVDGKVTFDRLSVNLRIQIPVSVFRIEKSQGTPAFKDVDTLEKMRGFWDEIASIKTFLEPKTPLFLLLQLGPHGQIIEATSWQPSANSDGFVLDKYDVGPVYGYQDEAASISYDFSEVLKNSKYRHYSIGGHELSDEELAKGVTLTIVYETVTHPFVPALGLDKDLGDKQDFSHAFPNLSSVDDIYLSKSFQRLGTALDAGAARQTGDIELFGTKFSRDLIPLFGLPILIVLLFQFSAVGFYGASRVQKLEEEDASQWSFLLKGWPFWILSCGAIFVLPSVASILSLWRFFAVPGETLLPRSVYIGLGIAVALISAIGFISLERLRRRVPRLSKDSATRYEGLAD
jgi:hypothetical protein